MQEVDTLNETTISVKDIWKKAFWRSYRKPKVTIYLHGPGFCVFQPVPVRVERQQDNISAKLSWKQTRLLKENYLSQL